MSTLECTLVHIAENVCLAHFYHFQKITKVTNSGVINNGTSLDGSYYEVGKVDGEQNF